MLATTVSAHEIGTTQVRALFKRDHTYVVDVVTSRTILDKRLHGDPVAKHVFLSFNGIPTAPQHAELMPDGIRITGDIPPHADAFTWRYDLVYSSYVLMLENESHGVTRQWLEATRAARRFRCRATLSRRPASPSSANTSPSDSPTSCRADSITSSSSSGSSC